MTVTTLTSSTVTIHSLPDDVLKLILKELRYEGPVSTWFYVMLTCKRFLRCGREVFDPSLGNNVAVRWAAIHDKVDCVRVLLADKRVNPSESDNAVIRWLCNNGRLELVKLVMKDPRVDPSAMSNYAVRWAADKGHIDIVYELLKDPRVDPYAAITWTAKYHSRNTEDSLKTIRKLLEHPRVDISKVDRWIVVFAYCSM